MSEGIDEVREAVAALQKPGLGMGMDFEPRNAARKLAILGGDDALDALIAALRNHPNEFVRAEVAIALGSIGDPRALDPLDKAAASDASRSNVQPMARKGAEMIREKQY